MTPQLSRVGTHNVQVSPEGRLKVETSKGLSPGQAGPWALAIDRDDARTIRAGALKWSFILLLLLCERLLRATNKLDWIRTICCAGFVCRVSFQ